MNLAEHIQPSRTALWALTRQNLQEAFALWRQRSIDEYAGQRVLSTRDLIRIFRSGRNVYMLRHIRNGRVIKAQVSHNVRTTVGLDWESQVLGGGNSCDSGTNTSASTTTVVTDTGKAWTVNAWKDHVLVTTAASGGLVAGRIVSNTATTATVDRWTSLTTLQTQMGTSTAGTGTAGSVNTGATQPYCILPGSFPALYLALDTSATTPAVGSTFASITEVSATGLARTPLAFAHTATNTFYTMTKTVTNSSGGPIGPVNNVAMLTTETGTGTLVFYAAISTPPTLANGDSIALTWTVNH